jgi:hypothetical protein
MFGFTYISSNFRISHHDGGINLAANLTKHLVHRESHVGDLMIGYYVGLTKSLSVPEVLEVIRRKCLN